MEYRLLVQIEPLEEGGYLAVCPQIEGCHAEGRTIGEAEVLWRSAWSAYQTAFTQQLLQRSDHRLVNRVQPSTAFHSLED